MVAHSHKYWTISSTTQSWHRQVDNAGWMSPWLAIIWWSITIISTLVVVVVVYRNIKITTKGKTGCQQHRDGKNLNFISLYDESMLSSANWIQGNRINRCCSTTLKKWNLISCFAIGVLGLASHWPCQTQWLIHIWAQRPNTRRWAPTYAPSVWYGILGFNVPFDTV